VRKTMVQERSGRPLGRQHVPTVIPPVMDRAVGEPRELQQAESEVDSAGGFSLLKQTMQSTVDDLKCDMLCTPSNHNSRGSPSEGKGDQTARFSRDHRMERDEAFTPEQVAWKQLKGGYAKRRCTSAWTRLVAADDKRVGFGQ
jgi:hypothetical protein